MQSFKKKEKEKVNKIYCRHCNTYYIKSPGYNIPCLCYRCGIRAMKIVKKVKHIVNSDVPLKYKKILLFGLELRGNFQKIIDLLKKVKNTATMIDVIDTIADKTVLSRENVVDDVSNDIDILQKEINHFFMIIKKY